MRKESRGLLGEAVWPEVRRLVELQLTYRRPRIRTHNSNRIQRGRSRQAWLRVRQGQAEE